MVWFVLPQGIRNFARQVGRGNANWETLVFNVDVDGWNAHFNVNINQKGNMVRRTEARAEVDFTYAPVGCIIIAPNLQRGRHKRIDSRGCLKGPTIVDHLFR